MHIKQTLLSAAIILLAAISLLATAQTATSEEEQNACATNQCHPGFMSKEPALPKGHTDCTHCHQGTDQAKNHPGSGTKSFSLSKDICLECHQAIIDYTYLHPPVAAGDCLACHTFHNTTPSLLIESQDHILCYSCHQAITHEGDTELHGDVAKQKCKSCHTAHGSFFKHLLAGPYSTDFFNAYDDKQYALCFQCHKIDLLLHPNTSYNTNFRDDQKNLHFVHVNRKTRGRSCKLCHVIHSGRQPKLMAEKVSFGDWEMPINFISDVNGGQCTPGCHAQASYNRNRRNSPNPPPQSTSPEAEVTQKNKH
jgi:predicted CXXCH cytochrome family protein